MKSRLRFALDGNNKAIIDGNIEHSEDLRDEVALQFRQNFKTTGNLATFHFCNGTNNQFSITPYGGDIEESKLIASNLPLYQLESLALAIELEKSNRFKSGAYTTQGTDIIYPKISIQSMDNLDLKVDKSYDKISSARKVNAGLKLSEIRIGVTLNSASDIDNLIEMLNSSMPCFEK